MAFSLLDGSSAFVLCIPLVGASTHSTSRCRLGVSATAQLHQRGLRLGKPEGHLHLALRRFVPRRNVAEEPQGIGLVAAFLVFTSVRQRTLGEGMRLL